MNGPPTPETGCESAARYQVRGLLGRGNGTEVWEAETADDRRVALKFLPWNNARTVQTKIESIQALHALRHPNLLLATEVWHQPGYLVIAMECADRSLADYLEATQDGRGHALAPEEALACLTPAAKALDFLNRRQHQLNGQCVGFQHGGVKLSNLLLFGRTVKLADFGLIAEAYAPLQGQRHAAWRVTAAPEVLQGWVSDRTDQYSLALVYAQLRGVELPCAESVMTAVPADGGGGIDLAALSCEERAIVARALHPTPQGRWASCRDLLKQLEQFVRRPGANGVVP